MAATVALLQSRATATLSSSPITFSSSSSSTTPAAAAALSYNYDNRNIRRNKNAAQLVGSSFRRKHAFVVSSSLETTEAIVGKVTEVDKNTFWPIVNAAGDKTVVLDMYTQWCGPCKIIAPKYQELSQKYDDVIFLKLDCNQENKPLAKELGIRVVPTFKILKHDKVVKEVTGAKIDDLVAALESVRAS